MPRILTYGVNETVCLSLHNVILPAKSIIDLQIKGRHYVTKRTIEAGKSLFCCTNAPHCSYRHRVIAFNAPITYRRKNLFVAVPVRLNINISLAEHTCFDISIPSLKHTEPSYVDVQMQIQINGTIESGQNQDPVLVYPHRNTILIQTDRQTYKPGDQVKIRLLALNQELFSDSRHKVNAITDL